MHAIKIGSVALVHASTEEEVSSDEVTVTHCASTSSPVVISKRSFDLQRSAHKIGVFSKRTSKRLPPSMKRSKEQEMRIVDKVGSDLRPEEEENEYQYDQNRSTPQKVRNSTSIVVTYSSPNLSNEPTEEIHKLNANLRQQENALAEAKQECQENLQKLQSEVGDLGIDRVQAIGKLKKLNHYLEEVQEKACNDFFRVPKGHENVRVSDVVETFQCEICELTEEHDQATQELLDIESRIEAKTGELEEAQQETHDAVVKLVECQKARDGTYRKMITTVLKQAGRVGKKQFSSSVSKANLRNKFRLNTDSASLIASTSISASASASASLIHEMSREDLNAQFVEPLRAGGHPGVQELSRLVSDCGTGPDLSKLRIGLIDIFGLTNED